MHARDCGGGYLESFQRKSRGANEGSGRRGGRPGASERCALRESPCGCGHSPADVTLADAVAAPCIACVDAREAFWGSGVAITPCPSTGSHGCHVGLLCPTRSAPCGTVASGVLQAYEARSSRVASRRAALSALCCAQWNTDEPVPELF